VSQSFQEHCRELAASTVALFNQDEPLRVLDIGCNDGTLLEQYRDLGCEVKGVDPARNLYLLSGDKGIPVVVDYWNLATAHKLNERYDLVTATNVFEALDSLVEFFTCCDIVLYDNGRLVLEFPYCERLLQNTEFDTIHHEHLNYFTVTSFVTLADKCGFAVDSVEKKPIHGGSLRFVLRKNFGQGHCRQVGELVAKERVSGLFNEEMYHSFADRVQRNRECLVNLLGDLQAQGRKIVGYGACTKGNTMLNSFGIDLAYIVDDNELKHDYKTPGRNIPIKHPKVLAEEQGPLHILVLGWNFYREIVGRVQAIRPDGRDTFILYVPEVTLEM
jgi:novobiocin biosynthesis protein NovU/D-mycarose 3-C-methyltransferase